MDADTSPRSYACRARATRRTSGVLFSRARVAAVSRRAYTVAAVLAVSPGWTMHKRRRNSAIAGFASAFMRPSATIFASRRWTNSADPMAARSRTTWWAVSMCFAPGPFGVGDQRQATQFVLGHGDRPFRLIQVPHELLQPQGLTRRRRGGNVLGLGGGA